MAKRGRPMTADQCRRTKPAESTDSRIVHCIRRIYHQPPCKNGGYKWTDKAVLERP